MRESAFHLVKHNKLESLPYVAGADKRAIRVDKLDAWHYERIAYNNSRFINTLIIDIDGGDICPYVAWQKTFPTFRPNAMVGKWMTSLTWQGKRLHRPHIQIHLRTPVCKDNEKQMNWFDAIRRELILRLSQAGLDVDPHLPLTTKNPVSESWHVVTFGEFYENKEWDLPELSLALGITGRSREENRERWRDYNALTKTRKGGQGVSGAAEGSRNTALFDAVRVQAYALKAAHGSYEELYSTVLDLCVEMNAEFTAPLSGNEVKGIARSISTWTWKNFDGTGYELKNRGAARRYIEDEDDLRKRQQKGAYYANTQREKKTLTRIKDAISAMKDAGKAPNKKGVAKISGLSLTTVKKHWDLALQGNVDVITESHRKLSGTLLSNVSLTETAGYQIHIETPKTRKEGGHYGVIRNDGHEEELEQDTRKHSNIISIMDTLDPEIGVDIDLEDELSDLHMYKGYGEFDENQNDIGNEYDKTILLHESKSLCVEEFYEDGGLHIALMSDGSRVPIPEFLL